MNTFPYNGKNRFDRAQLIFATSVMIASYVDMVEETLPSSPNEQSHYSRETSEHSEHYGMRSLGWNLSILYAQLRDDGDGISTGDVIDLLEKTGLRDQVKSLIALRFFSGWQGFKEGDLTHNVNYSTIAEAVVEKLFNSSFGDYLYDKPSFLWLRIGDGGEYEKFGDDFDALADALYEGSVPADGFAWRADGTGFETPNYPGQNYVSLFWGDEQGNLVEPLSIDERRDVEARLRKLEK